MYSIRSSCVGELAYIAVVWVGYRSLHSMSMVHVYATFGDDEWMVCWTGVASDDEM